jgi:hypothetical protein
MAPRRNKQHQSANNATDAAAAAAAAHAMLLQRRIIVVAPETLGLTPLIGPAAEAARYRDSIAAALSMPPIKVVDRQSDLTSALSLGGGGGVTGIAGEESATGGVGGKDDVRSPIPARHSSMGPRQGSSREDAVASPLPLVERVTTTSRFANGVPSPSAAAAAAAGSQAQVRTVITTKSTFLNHVVPSLLSIEFVEIPDTYAELLDRDTNLAERLLTSSTIGAVFVVDCTRLFLPPPPVAVLLQQLERQHQQYEHRLRFEGGSLSAIARAARGAAGGDEQSPQQQAPSTTGYSAFLMARESASADGVAHSSLRLLDDGAADGTKEHRSKGRGGRGGEERHVTLPEGGAGGNGALAPPTMSPLVKGQLQRASNRSQTAFTELVGRFASLARAVARHGQHAAPIASGATSGAVVALEGAAGAVNGPVRTSIALHNLDAVTLHIAGWADLEDWARRFDRMRQPAPDRPLTMPGSPLGAASSPLVGAAAGMKDGSVPAVPALLAAKAAAAASAAAVIADAAARDAPPTELPLVPIDLVLRVVGFPNTTAVSMRATEATLARSQRAVQLFATQFTSAAVATQDARTAKEDALHRRNAAGDDVPPSLSAIAPSFCVTGPRDGAGRTLVSSFVAQPRGFLQEPGLREALAAFRRHCGFRRVFCVEPRLGLVIAVDRRVPLTPAVPLGAMLRTSKDAAGADDARLAALARDNLELAADMQCAITAVTLCGMMGVADATAGAANTAAAAASPGTDGAAGGRDASGVVASGKPLEVLQVEEEGLARFRGLIEVDYPEPACVAPSLARPAHDTHGHHHHSESHHLPTPVSPLWTRTTEAVALFGLPSPPCVLACLGAAPEVAEREAQIEANLHVLQATVRMLMDKARRDMAAH